MSFTFHSYRPVTQEEQNPMNALITNALNTYKKTNEAIWQQPNLREDLKKKQLYNQYYGPEKEANIGLTHAQTGESGARTGYIGQQSKYYGKDIQSQMALRDAQMAQARAAAQKAQMIANLISGNDQNFGGQQGGNQPGNAPTSQYQPGQGQAPFASPEMQGGQQQINSTQAQPQVGSQYGIAIPKPTRDDLRNKIAFGMDTYSPNRDQAINQISDQKKQYTEKVVHSNMAAQSAGKTDQLLDQYNYWMDQATASGPFAGHLPATGAASQNVNQIINTMIPEAMQNVRQAMESARFSNMDLGVAQGMKPQRTWTPETREFYTNSVKAFNERVKEKAAFDQVTSNPDLGIQSNVADSLWTAYQNHHPIVKSAAENEMNRWPKNGWQKYLTPEAVKSIENTGDYNPKDKPLPNITPDMARKELERRRKAKEHKK